MNLELNEYQTKLVIFALEKAAFERAKQAGEHRNQNLITEATDLFLLASKCRQGIGWPEYDSTKTIGIPFGLFL